MTPVSVVTREAFARGSTELLQVSALPVDAVVLVFPEAWVSLLP